MKNKLVRILGIIVGLLFIVVGPLLGAGSGDGIGSILGTVLLGVVFIYFGLTNRSVLKDLFSYWSK